MLAFVVSPSKIKRKFLRVLLCVLFRSSFSTGPIWMVRDSTLFNPEFNFLHLLSPVSCGTLNIQAHINPHLGTLRV